MANEILIASSEEQTNTHGNPTASNQAASYDTSHTAAASGHGTSSSSDPSAVFTELLGGLGDHHDLTIFNVKVLELPIIIYDQGEGFHVYKSMESMTESNQFVMNAHHKIAPVKNIEQPVTLDLSITNLVCFQWMAILLVLFVFGWAGKKFRKNPTKAPSGVQTLTEMAYTFVKDDIVVPNIGSEKLAAPLMPYFVSLFLFIFGMNLLGLLPGGHSASGAIGTTLALALTALFVINGKALFVVGPVNFLKHLTGGAPWYLWIIIVPIEILSIFIKPFALTIRLFANMTAGHIILLSFIGLIFFFARSGLAAGIVAGGIAPASVAFSVFIMFLESLVAFLQAYIFTLLTAVFTGLSLGEHAHD